MNIDPKTDPYQTLGVKDSASAAEIKKAYRRLAQKHHPDRGGDDARFKDISSAYDVVGDEKKRAEYDSYRAGPQMPPGFSGGFGGNAGFDIGDIFSMFSGGSAGASPGGSYRVYSSGGGSPFSRHGDPLGDIGRSQARPREPAPPTERRVRARDGSQLLQKGADIHSDIHLAFDQAALGTVVKVPTLEGSASVTIPAGTGSGVKLRLKGKGAPKSNGTRGNHYVTVQIDVPKQLDEKAKRLLAQLMERVRKK